MKKITYTLKELKILAQEAYEENQDYGDDMQVSEFIKYLELIEQEEKKENK